MRFFLFLLMFITFVPHASAQGTTAQSDQIDELLGQKKVIKRPETVQAYKREYYKQCVAREYPTIGGKDLERMCRCTSEAYAKTFTVEQIRAMEGNAEGSGFQRARLLTFVYAPCIQQPTYTMFATECIDSPTGKYLMRNPRTTCHCIADHMSKDLAEYADRLIRARIRRGERLDDPLGTILHPDAVRPRSYYFNDLCVKRHEPR